MPKEKNQDVDILDQIKKAEKIKLLMENMEQLKANTLKIAELKKANKIIFEKVGLIDKEIKQIIDYIKDIKIEKTVFKFVYYHSFDSTVDYPHNIHYCNNDRNYVNNPFTNSSFNYNHNFYYLL